VLDAKVDGATRLAPRPHGSESAPDALPDAEVHEALDLLASARQPVILAGPAMARAARWGSIERFAALSGIPALPIESPRGLNDPWLHLAAPRLSEADVVVLAGRRPDFTVRFAESPPFQPGSRFIRIDWDGGRDERPGFLTITADPQRVFERLSELAAKHAWRPGWGAELQRARRTVPAGWEALRRAPGTPLHPLHVCMALQPWLDEGAVLVGDGGEFGQWIQGGTEATVRLINGPAGAIGGGIPMGCAAKLAYPARHVIVAVGDGTFGFHAFELDTALRHRLPIVVVVGNDARWNAEHRIQLERFGPNRTVGCELRPTRYDLVATALGGHGEHVERAEDLAPALGRAIASGLPACVDVAIDGVAAPEYRAGTSAH